MAKKTTTTKKATAKKAPAKKAGFERPTFTIDVARNRKLTERQSLWLKLKEGTVQLVYPPPLDGTGIIHPQTSLHYDVPRFDDPKKIMAPACLKVHGDGNCYICNFIEWLKQSGDAVMMGIADDLYPQNKYNAQVFVLDPTSKEWTGPQLFSMGKKMTDELGDMMSISEDTGTPMFCDPEYGQIIAITRRGTTKYDTRYSLKPTGLTINMYEKIPDWYERAFKDLTQKVIGTINILDVDQQKERLFTKYPDLPWEDIEKDIG